MRSITFKAVLFDLDDTLVPEMEAEREALLAACGLASMKYGTDAQEMSVSVEEAANNLWAKWPSASSYSSIAYSGWEGLWGPPDVPDDGLGNDQETINQYKRDAWDEVLANHGIHDTGLRDEIIVRHRSERVARLQTNPGAVEALNQLKDEYPLAIVTNGSPAVQRFKIERSGIADYFDVVVASGDVGVGKPGALPFTTALEKLGVKPTEAVMIGNSWKSDVQGAVNLRMRSIWFNPDSRPRPETGVAPIAEIISLAEIPKLLGRIAAGSD